MKIEKGKNRIVFIFKHFVIKFPRIFFLKAILSTLRLNKEKYLFIAMKWHMYGYLTGPKQLLFRGISENRNEYLFYYRYKLNILLPTYFSLFGLLNIQKTGEKLGFEKEYNEERKKILSFWHQITQITNMEAFSDGHHFSNPKNFCKENGRLKIIDYGSLYTQKVLEKYGDKIYREFDLSKC